MFSYYFVLLKEEKMFLKCSLTDNYQG